MRDAFGLSHLSDKAMVPGLEEGLPDVPSVDPNYVFEDDTLRQLWIFWVSGLKGLLVEGDPAAGKSSLILQWHARLNVPLYLVPCSPSTESWHLFGQLLPTTDGKGLRWHDGPVLRACREGTSVLLDERNLLDPGVALGLNSVLEGYPITIPETGEVVTPQKSTRFFATENPVDSKAMVAGRNVQDVTFDDRWSYMRVDYVKPETEKALIKRQLMKAPNVPEQHATTIAEIVVTVGNKVREAFRNDEPAIDKPLSTRVLLRWAQYTLLYMAPMKAQGKSAIHYAARVSVRMSPAMSDAVQETITLVAGYGPDLK